MFLIKDIIAFFIPFLIPILIRRFCSSGEGRDRSEGEEGEGWLLLHFTVHFMACLVLDLTRF